MFFGSACIAHWASEEREKIDSSTKARYAYPVMGGLQREKRAPNQSFSSCWLRTLEGPM